MIKKVFGITLLFVLGACEFNQSVEKNLTTGADSRGKGIGCASVTMEINGQNENRNVFVYGEKVIFLFNDVSGLTKEGGKVFPGLSMVIVKNQKDTVMSHSDLFADQKQGFDLDPLQLSAKFVSTLPFENQEKYKIYIKIWDKKGKGTFSYEMPFTVKKNELLQIKSNNLIYKDIYLWNEDLKEVVTDKKLNAKNTYFLILEEFSGMKQIDGNIYPAFSIELTDSKGNKIISNPNILQAYETVGFPSERFAKGQLPVTITFGSGQVNNPYTLSASLTDKKSDKRIDIQTKLEIK